MPNRKTMAMRTHATRRSPTSELSARTWSALRLASCARRTVVAVRSALVIAFMVSAAAAHAQDRFEIQVYDSETAPPGEFGVEHHINVAAVGRTTVVDGELPTDQVTHFTFEPHIGLLRWCEAGAYFQT